MPKMPPPSYDSVGQVDDDRDVASDASHSDYDSRSPSPNASKQRTGAFEPVPLDQSNLGGNLAEPSYLSSESMLSRLGSMVQRKTSKNSGDYNMVEEDDYEDGPNDQPASKRSSPCRVDASAERSETLDHPNKHAVSPDDGPVVDDVQEGEHSSRILTRYNTPIGSPEPLDDLPPEEEEPALRSVSSSTLSHPMPGLQSIQGAYVGNVERLERSAEHLSMTSSDIGSEIRKMDLLQKKRSASIASNSTRLRSDTFSPVTRNSSTHGSTRSGTGMRSVSGGSRLAQLPEPDHGRFVDDDDDEEGDYASTRGTSISPVLTPFRNLQQEEDGAASMYTVASGETYQQARILFRDFDGVHFVPSESAVPSRTISRRSLASRAETAREYQPDEDMVYYPAPVPMMLNLPPLLSQKSSYEKANRKKQIFGPTHPEGGKSAVSAPPVQIAPIEEEPSPAAQEQPPSGKRPRRRLTKAPPQLRANAYFDKTGPPRSLPQEIPEVKQASAVATLDGILDASVNAPASAFLDHPFVGRLGPEIYGKSDNRPSSSRRPASARRPASTKGAQKKKKYASRSTVALPTQTEEVPGNDKASTIARTTDGEYEGSTGKISRKSSMRTGRSGPAGDQQSSIYEDAIQLSNENSENEENEESDEEENEEEEEEEGDEIEEDYYGPPTTLLGELQTRKQELQNRRRTAAVSNGMQSTLLQLETVAQKQSEQRRHRRVMLAWEDPELLDRHKDGDDDVPLGVLYPDSNIKIAAEGRPLGLLERKEMEEGEPLSRRRARLQGVPPPPLNLPRYPVPASQAEPESEDEGETLAQRMERLRAAKGDNKDKTDEKKNSISSTFTTEVLNQLGLGKEKEKENEGAKEAKKDGKEKDNMEGETLGERRRRLQQKEGGKPQQQQQQQQQNNNTLKTRRSMADILQEYPANTHDQKMMMMGGGARGNMNTHHQLPPSRSMYQLPGFNQTHNALYQSQYAMVNPYMRSPAYGVNPYARHTTLGLGGNFGQGVPYGYKPTQQPSTIEPAQREMIERWRESVVK